MYIHGIKSLFTETAKNGIFNEPFRLARFFYFFLDINIFFRYKYFTTYSTITFLITYKYGLLDNIIYSSRIYYYVRGTKNAMICFLLSGFTKSYSFLVCNVVCNSSKFADPINGSGTSRRRQMRAPGFSPRSD